MLYTFFNYLFPPLFMVTIVGMVWGIRRLWKCGNRQGVFLLCALGILAVACRWRSGDLSGRYIILVVPAAILFCIYFLFHCRIPTALVRLFLIAVVISAVLKSVHYNPHADCIIKIGALIRADAEEYENPILIDFSRRTRLLGYYSGLVRQVEVLAFSGHEFRAKLPLYMEDYRYRGDAVYVVVREKNEDPYITAADIASPAGEWLRLGSYFYNRREESRMSIYKFVPHIRFAANAVPENDADYRLLENGDFEKLAATPAWPELEKFHDRKIVFFDQPELKLPIGWKPNPGQGYSVGWEGAVEVESATPLRGNHSLRLIGNGTSFCTSAIAGKATTDRLNVRVWAQARQESRFGIWLYFYDGSRFVTSRGSGLVTVPESRETHQYRFELELPSDMVGKNFRVAIFLAGGNMVFDDISIALPLGQSKEQGSTP